MDGDDAGGDDGAVVGRAGRHVAGEDPDVERRGVRPDVDPGVVVDVLVPDERQRVAAGVGEVQPVEHQAPGSGRRPG